MDPELIALLVEKNTPDIEAIIAKVGIGTLLTLLPNIVRIVQTVRGSVAQAPASVSERSS
jgi:hypothetical protein